MTEYDPPEPFNAFYEVVTVGRKWHLIPDVKIYYISESRSECTLTISPKAHETLCHKIFSNPIKLPFTSRLFARV